MHISFVDYCFDNEKSVSSIILNKFPSVWLENKRKADKAEGLWRIHDGLYDVTNFIKVHPGGKFWLEETRGMDVTELFESHHIKSDVPEKMLKQFYVREANQDRLAKYTFDDDGFYRTVKRRVREVLKMNAAKNDQHSHFYTDLLVVTTIVLACLANCYSIYNLAIVVGMLHSFCVIAAHNYLHMKDNWRMHYADVFGIPFRLFRIAHVLSHHMYPNTAIDIQLNFTVPIGNPLPVPKNFFIKYLSWVYIPLILWPLIIYVAQIISILEYFVISKNKPSKTLLLPLLLPTIMFFSSKQSAYSTFLILQVIILTAGFSFGLIAFTLNHIHPDIYVDGDLTRSKKEMDWGISQLDTTQDRHLVTGNKFLVLLTFGDHALHHLFPTVDHSVLNELYPVVEKTLHDFNINSIRMTSHIDLFLGYFRRLRNELPNLNPHRLGYAKKFY